MLNEKRLLAHLAERPHMLGEQFLAGDHVRRVISDVTVTANDRCGFVNSAKHRLDQCAFTRLHVRGADAAEDWGFRLYNLTGSSWVDVLVEGIKYEHGIYANVHGHNRFQRVTVRSCGSQGMQFARRGRHHGGLECINPAQYATPGWLELEDVVIDNCGTDTGRRVGFALSVFRSQGEAPEGIPAGADGTRWKNVTISHVGASAKSGEPRAFVVQGDPFGYRSFIADDLVCTFPATTANELAEIDRVPVVEVGRNEMVGPPVKVRLRPSDAFSWAPGSGSAELWLFDATTGKPVRKTTTAAGFYKKAGVAL